MTLGEKGWEIIKERRNNITSIMEYRNKYNTYPPISCIENFVNFVIRKPHPCEYHFDIPPEHNKFQYKIILDSFYKIYNPTFHALSCKRSKKDVRSSSLNNVTVNRNTEKSASLHVTTWFRNSKIAPTRSLKGKTINNSSVICSISST